MGRSGFNGPKNVIAQPYDESVSLGLQPGVSAFIGFGLKADVGTSLTDISASVPLYTWQQTAQRVQATSTDVNDTFLGTGARVIFVEGLDVNFNEITDIIIMDGLTPAFTTLLFIRVNFMFVVQVGTYGDSLTGGNIGTLAFIHETTTNPIDTMLPQVGQTEFLRYTTPRDVPALFRGFSFNISASKPASIKLQTRIDADVFAAPFGARFEGFSASSTAETFQFLNRNPFLFPPLTDIWANSIAEQMNTPVNVAFTLELHRETQ